jgi:hypothetical protein
MHGWRILGLLAIACSHSPLLACATSTATSSREQTQPRSSYEQSLDSATNACRQNPAYCASAAGEEVIVPQAGRVIRVIPPDTTTSEKVEETSQQDSSSASSESSDTETSDVRVPTTEERQRRRDLCRDYYDRCIQAGGGKPGRKHNETQCQACYDYCYRIGFWPARANGKVCRGT